MARKLGGQVNASLIREGRMLWQQFSPLLRNAGEGRQPNFHAARIAEAEAKARVEVAKAAAKASSALKCVFCLTVRPRDPLDAVSIKNGQAVCSDHAHCADASDFKAGLARLINSENKPD